MLQIDNEKLDPCPAIPLAIRYLTTLRCTYVVYNMKEDLKEKVVGRPDTVHHASLRETLGDSFRGHTDVRHITFQYP